MPVFLKQLAEIGFSGVQNFPTVGLIDGSFRSNLEGTGMGYGKEVDAIHEAHLLDLFTSPYVFDGGPGRVDGRGGRRHARGPRGAHHVGEHRRHRRHDPRGAIETVEAIAAAGHGVREDMLVICHGGPFDEPRTWVRRWGGFPPASGSSVHRASSASRPSAPSPSR